MCERPSTSTLSLFGLLIYDRAENYMKIEMFDMNGKEIRCQFSINFVCKLLHKINLLCNSCFGHIHNRKNNLLLMDLHKIRKNRFKYEIKIDR